MPSNSNFSTIPEEFFLANKTLFPDDIVPDPQIPLIFLKYGSNESICLYVFMRICAYTHNKVNKKINDKIFCLIKLKKMSSIYDYFERGEIKKKIKTAMEMI